MSTPGKGDCRSEAAANRADIAGFFDEMSVGRNEKINANPIVAYEQQVRSVTVLRLLDAKQGEVILDIGCGNARDILQILRAGAQVVGVDISEGMVSAAKHDLASCGFDHVMLQVGDATKLHFPDQKFDKILCSEVIEHIPDAQKALTEMWRVLKPGGSVVLSTPNPNSWYGIERYIVWQGILRRKWNHPFDEWRSMATLEKMVVSAGFCPSVKTGACYVPGFLVTYFVLPRLVQRALLKCVECIEPVVSRLFPGVGYMVCLKATKLSD